MPDAALLERMSALLAHRGPDASGTAVEGAVGLAHRRLAIIDLSDEGCQPMTSGDGALTIVFNGEVFNYLELRAELIGPRARIRDRHRHRGRARRVRRQWGHASLSRFNGMFAFAIWNGGGASCSSRATDSA